MTAARAVPATELPASANDKFKSHFTSLLSGSLIAATVVHFLAFSYWPSLSTQDVSFTSDELTSIELPPDIEIPPPPKAIARPATPVIAETKIDMVDSLAREKGFPLKCTMERD